MTEINPLLLTGGVIGAITAILVAAYALVKDKKATMGFERTMNDGEIMRRLMAYAKPYRKQFVVVLFLMLFSIAYDIISPLIVGALEELVSGEFELPRLFAGVAVYAGVLVFSMASTYLQAVILQRVGQRIVRRAGGFDRRFGRIVVFRGDFCGQRVDLRVDCLRRFLFGQFFFICGERAFRRRQFRIRSYQSACVLAQRVVRRSRGDDRRLRRRVIFGVDARGQGF